MELSGDMQQWSLELDVISYGAAVSTCERDESSREGRRGLRGGAAEDWSPERDRGVSDAGAEQLFNSRLQQPMSWCKCEHHSHMFSSVISYLPTN